MSRPRLVRGALVLLFVAALAYTAHVTVGLGGRHHENLWNHWVSDGVIGASAILCLWRARVSDDRLAWAAIGLSVVLYWLGDLYYNNFLASQAHPPYPSWADAGWLVYYLPLYLGMMLLIRARTSRLLAATWLEGLVGALALASVAATFVFAPVVASTQGKVAEVATNLAYPTFDVLLLALVAAGFALQGHRAGRSWILLGFALLFAGAADAVYLVQVANETYTEGGWLNAGWPLSTTFIALAAWTPSPRIAPSADDADGWSAHLLTGFFALLIVGVLALEAVQRIPIVAHVLLTMAVVALLARLALAGRERRALARTTVEANTDELTGLANRRCLYEAADRALEDGGSVALLLLDLDRFKELNDTLGHNAGDDLLCQVATRLQNALSPRGLLARIGGDEFVVLLDAVHDEAEAEARGAAQALQEALEEPFPIEGFVVPAQVSIGIALAPDHAGIRSELLRCADIAMYRAKSHRTGIESYQAAGDERSRDHLLLVSELRQALGSDELVLHYQPKVSVAEGRFTGVEALVRWQHPRLGLLSPAEFVPLAEREGLMRLLTLAVLNRALDQQREWREAGDEVPVAVNLSPADLLDTRLPDDVAELMERYKTPPRLLELEITEDTLMRDPERALDVLARISELGVEFSLDDFGIGYSSLAQLKRLPVRTLKIDRSFIMQMTENEEDANIVRSTIQLGHSLNLHVVAEGVEDPRACAGTRGVRVRHGSRLLPQPPDPRRGGHALAAHPRAGRSPLGRGRVGTKPPRPRAPRRSRL